MKTIVTGVFDDVASASRAVTALVGAGHDPQSISLVLPDAEGGSSLSEDKGRRTVEATEPSPRRAATLGAIMGASGLALGATVLLPGLLAVGPIVALLLGAGSGALSGGFLGGLIGIGVSRDLAEVYHRSLEGGAVMLGVEAPLEQATRVQEMLLGFGGRALADVTFH